MIAEYDKAVIKTHALHGLTQHAICLTVNPVNRITRPGISFFMQWMLRINPPIKHV